MLPLLSTLIFLPLIGGLITFFSGANARKTALTIALAELVLSAWVLLTHFSPAAGMQLVEDYWWVESLGISYKIGIDGISMALVLLTNVLLPLIILSAFGRAVKSPALYFGLMLLMQSALVGVFVALDGFLFYIFWELALIPIYLICLNWGGENRSRITLKFFIYTLFGSLLMLVAFIWMRTQTQNQSFDIDQFYALKLSAGAQSWVFWALFLAFAIKMPVFPFHTWQPDTYTDSPTQGTMLLSGIMLKMGIYGVMRWMLPVLPQGIASWGTLAVSLAVIGIVYASLIAWVQKDFKRLIAYSSIAHVGMIAAAIFTLSSQGLVGGVVQMLSHGVNVVGLFFVADILMNRSNTRDLGSLGGIRTVAPAFATSFMIVLLGSVALPLTNGFIGEFMLMSGIFRYSAMLAAIAGLSVIFGDVYMLRAYRKIMLGESTTISANFTDLSWNEKAVLYPLVLLIFLFGVYPEPIIQLVTPSVQQLQDVITNAGAATLR
jgi:NADH-quinone oxidoreductase subunit M